MYEQFNAHMYPVLAYKILVSYVIIIGIGKVPNMTNRYVCI